MNKKITSWVKFSIIGFLIVLWISLLFILDLENIVNSLGVHNIYIIIFVLAATAGGSSFTAPSFYGVIYSFMLGGVPLFLIIILSGLGSTIGDCVYLYFGKQGHEVLSSKFKKRLDKIIRKIESKPRIIMQLFIFAYAAFSPMPNDILTISLGVSGYKIKNVIVPILLGNIIYFFLLLSIAKYIVSGSLL